MKSSIRTNRGSFDKLLLTTDGFVPGEVYGFVSKNLIMSRMICESVLADMILPDVDDTVSIPTVVYIRLGKRRLVVGEATGDIHATIPRDDPESITDVISKVIEHGYVPISICLTDIATDIDRTGAYEHLVEALCDTCIEHECVGITNLVEVGNLTEVYDSRYTRTPQFLIPTVARVPTIISATPVGAFGEGWLHLHVLKRKDTDAPITTHASLKYLRDRPAFKCKSL